MRLTNCPNCGAKWSYEEQETDACDKCGYPNHEVNTENHGNLISRVVDKVMKEKGGKNYYNTFYPEFVAYQVLKHEDEDYKLVFWTKVRLNETVVTYSWASKEPPTWQDSIDAMRNFICMCHHAESNPIKL